MAADEIITVHPGDIIQDSEGLIYLVSETHRWGLGAVLRWRARDGEEGESYHRFKPGQFVVVGSAATLPKEVAVRRADSLRLERELARDKTRKAAAKGSGK